jgi:hypothetical protein
MSNSKGSKSPAAKVESTSVDHIEEIDLLCRRAKALAEIVAEATPGLEYGGAYGSSAAGYHSDEHPVPWVMQILQDEINRIKEHAHALVDRSVG